jgi:lipase (class 3)
VTTVVEQQMMTLAAIAPNAATVRPSGETLAQQQTRILLGVRSLLANPSLATAGSWEPIWLALTEDRANLAYIAANTAAPESGPEYAIVLRGTFGGSPIDVAEDTLVSEMLPFAYAGGAAVSQGAMQAFTEITSAVSTQTGSGTILPAAINLLSALNALDQAASGAKATPTFYLTGHSLGGSLATTLSLYLQAQPWSPTPSFQVYTFAAPTAGGADFANYFNEKFPQESTPATQTQQATCVWNGFDIVPNAWWNLTGSVKSGAVEYFFAKPVSPGWSAATVSIVTAIADKLYPSGNPKIGPPNVYVQPDQQDALNVSDGKIVYLTQFPPDATDTQQWEAQAGFQHANNTYLTLLGAPLLYDVVPIVAGIAPSSGDPTGGTQITITAGTPAANPDWSAITPPPAFVPFGPDSVVDFGTVPAAWVDVSGDGMTIQATAPAGAGVVDVRVTNRYGTSAVVPADQFTYTPS